MPRKLLDHVDYRIFFRGCGVAGILGGMLHAVWGYVENSGGLIHVLSFVVPALFLVAVVGLCVLCRGARVLGWVGMGLATYGLGWGIVSGIVGDASMWAYFAQRGWTHLVADWFSFTLAGLTLMGIASVREKPSRGWGVLALALGSFGWIYDLTDTGALLETRSVHIGFGLLFSLCWVALGVGLLAVETSLNPIGARKLNSEKAPSRGTPLNKDPKDREA